MKINIRDRIGIESLAWAIVLAIAAIIAIVPAGWHAQYMRIDDSFYYPIIARNIARGLGSTYDGGITLTNGYHPLWAWLHVPLAWLSGKTLSLTYLHLSNILMVVTTVLAIFIWWRVIRRVFEDQIAPAVFVLLLGSYWWSISYFYGGLETPLVVLFMGASMLQAQRIVNSESLSLLDAIFLGALMGATFLARLDSVFYLSILSLALLIYYVRQRAYKPLLAIPGTVLILTIPYLLWNLIRFGNLIPVSGLKKTVGLNLADGLVKMSIASESLLGKVLEIIPPIILLILIIAGLAIMITMRQQIVIAFRKWGVLKVLPIGALIHFLYTSFIMSEGHVGWYHYAEYLSLYLILATLTHAFVLFVNDKGWRRLTYAPFAIVVLAIATQFVFLITQSLANPHRAGIAVYDTAMWSKENLPPDSRIGMYDSGMFQFISGLDTISLNGLAGDAELMNLAIENDIRSIISRYDLDYVVTFTTSPAWYGNYTSLGDVTFESPYIVYRDDTQIDREKRGFRILNFVVIDSNFYLESEDIRFKTGTEK